MATTLTVGMGEVKVSSTPGEALCARGLGSCVGLIAYDSEARTAGLAHIVLPTLGPAQDESSAPAKWAGAAVLALVQAMEGAGCERGRMAAAIAGGADVLSQDDGWGWSIGKRNTEIVRSALQDLGLSVKSWDIGGQQSRTVYVYLPEGRVEVQTPGGRPRVLTLFSAAEDAQRLGETHVTT